MRNWLRVTRAPLAGTAILDAIAALILALAAADIRLTAVEPGMWALLALTSLLLYLGGMAGNDWADRHRDRELAPGRPLPSGALSPTAVGLFVLLATGAAIVLGGGAIGSRWMVVGCAACAWLYNGIGKHHVVPAALLMTGVRFCNAAIAVVPLVLADLAPAWVLLGPLWLGLYSGAVVVLSTTEEAGSRARVWFSRVLAAACFVGAAVTAWVAAGVPTLGVFLAFGVASSAAFGRTPRPGPAKKKVLEMLLAFYLLEFVVASAVERGSFEGQGALLVLAFAMIWISQRMIFALMPKAPAVTVPSDDEEQHAS